MAVKYKCEYKAFDNSNWKVEIYLDTWQHDAIILTGVSEQPVIIDQDSSDTDDVYSPYIYTTAHLSFYNTGIDVNELQLAFDKDFKVEIYKEQVLKFSGYLTSEGIERPLSGSVDTIDLTATDMLSILDEMPYQHADLPSDKDNTINVRCPLNYMRQILFSPDNVGLPLPIRWSNNLRCTAFNDDVFAGQVAWGVDNVGLYSYTTTDTNINAQLKSCGYILGGFMRSQGARILQANGKWVIRRINLYPSKSFSYKQVQGDLGLIVLNGGIDTIAKNIGSNISGAYPLIREDAKVLVDPGLKSCKVKYEANVAENILPNGSQDKTITPFEHPYYWGYVSSNVSSADSASGIDGRSGKSTKLYNSGTIGIDPNTYFVLNEDNETQFGLPIDGKVLVSRIQFGFVFSIVSGFGLDNDGFVDFTNNPLHIQVILNTYFGIFYLNENGFWQNDPVEISIIPADNTKIKPLDSVRIDFNRFQGVLMPEPDAELDTSKDYNIKIRFRTLLKQEYYVDNIYINIDDNNDIYEAGLENTRNTKTSEVSLDISSSYGGYMLSNFMTSWKNSNKEFMFAEGAFAQGSLTSILARAIMRCKYAPQRKVDLTINVRGLEWSFDELYSLITFGTTVFVPVKASYNTELCEVKLTIVECRNDNVSLYTKHYGSNDNILSN